MLRSSNVTPAKLNDLRELIATALSNAKAQRLPAVCQQFGLADGDGAEAFSSKRRYVLVRIENFPEPALLELAQKVNAEFPNFQLSELTEKLRPSAGYRISELTRRALVRELDKLGSLSGNLGLVDFLSRIWPLSDMKAADGDEFRCSNAADSVAQHMVRNEDWTVTELCEFLDVIGVSDTRFANLLEMAVAPMVREEPEQRSLVDRLNQLLVKDGCELRCVDEQSGSPIFAVVPMLKGVPGRAKNLIFAADGFKPELVFADAVNNDVEIVKNAEYCLIYDETVPSTGLLWKDLVSWWARQNNLLATDRQTARGLYARLMKSLSSEPEKLLFREYYRQFKSLGDTLPALIPQVYLHYDPYTARQLAGTKRLVRERMDFLLLLSNHHRIVIEVDGKHHYAEGNAASPRLYAEMVTADRNLKLAGYEIYRFGGHEFCGGDAPERIGSFFERLFRKYQRR